MKKKLFRITTVPASLGGLLKGQLKFMSDYYEIVGISSTGKNGHLQRIAHEEGIEVLSVEMTRKITPLKDLQATWILYKIFKKERPFIVHTHTPKAGTLGMLAAYMAGIPHRLHTIAGLPLLEARGLKRRLLDQVEKITYSCATRIYPNSYGLKDIVIENNYAKASKLHVIGNGSSNGINTSDFDPAIFDKSQEDTLRNSLQIDRDDFVFIFVGRLVRDKGVNELVNAFEKICGTNNKVKLLLVGTYEKDLDPLEAQTELIIDTNQQIIAVGWQDDVRPFFAISDVLVFPSYREGFPNVVMQAGAMGLKCIATDINGCNEIIIDGENGVLIPPKDEKSLKEQMELAMANVKKDQSMNYCRQLIVERYDQMYIWKALLDEYQKLETSQSID
jgi:glycosyltransferase involved in cell wall biosynthesis